MLAHSLREEGGTKGKGSCYGHSLEYSRPWVESAAVLGSRICDMHFFFRLLWFVEVGI